MLQNAFKALWKTIAHYNQFVNQFMRVSQDTPDPGMAYVNWGIDLAEAGKMDEAAEKFEQAVAMAPDRPEPWNNWGVSLAKQGRIDEAIEKFEHAYRVDKQSVKALTMWGAALLEKGDIDGAEVKYKEAIGLAPGNPEPFVNWGIGLARLARYQDAIKHFQMALTIYPYQGDVYFLWGAALAELSRYEDAIAKFQEAVRFMPDHAESHYFWAIALNRLKRYDDAIEINQKALERDPVNPEIYLNLGDTYGNLGDYDKAVNAFRQAIALNAAIPEAYASLGVALGKQQAYDEAYACFGRALELDPLFSKVYYHWGSLLNQQRRFAEACMYLKHYYDAYPEDVDNLINYGLALTHTGDKQQGLALLKEAQKVDSDNPQIHFLMGTQYLLHNQLDKAVHHLRLALENNSHFVDAAINLSLALSESGSLEEATRTLRPFVRQYPNSPDIQFFYATIQYRSGDYRDAQQRLERVLELSPTYGDAYLGLIELHTHRAEFDKAFDYVDRLKTFEPDFVPALRLEAQAALAAAQHPQYAENASVKTVFLGRARRAFEVICGLEANASEALEGLQTVDTLAGAMTSSQG
jgi:tetratricopeptide (TPR) repeat protein